MEVGGGGLEDGEGVEGGEESEGEEGGEHGAGSAGRGPPEVGEEGQEGRRRIPWSRGRRDRRMRRAPPQRAPPVLDQRIQHSVAMAQKANTSNSC